MFASPSNSKLQDGRGQVWLLTTVFLVHHVVRGTEEATYNVFAEALFAVPLNRVRGKRNWKKKKITLQTSKLIYKREGLGIMKKSLKVQKERISTLPRASYLLNVSPIITLAFPSLIHCN